MQFISNIEKQHVQFYFYISVLKFTNISNTGLVRTLLCLDSSCMGDLLGIAGVTDHSILICTNDVKYHSRTCGRPCIVIIMPITRRIHLHTPHENCFIFILGGIWRSKCF